MEEIKRLEREIALLEEKLRQQSAQAQRERRNIIDENKKNLQALKKDMDRAIREHDRQTQKQYERLLGEYQKNLSNDMQRELSNIDASYNQLLSDVRRNEQLLMEKNNELEAAINKLRTDISKKNEGSSKEARQYIANAIGVFKAAHKKPHERFTPKRMKIYYDTIKDGQHLYETGLYEAASAVALSARTGIKRLEVTIDDKKTEWEEQFGLLCMKLDYISAKIGQELRDWEEFIGENGDDPEKKKLHLIEINYWTKGNFESLVKNTKKIQKAAAEVKETGTEEYLKKKRSLDIDEIRAYTEELSVIENELASLSELYKKRYSMSCQRASWGEEIIDFLTGEINLIWKEELTGFREAGEDTLRSRDFIDYINACYGNGSVTEDSREWLRLVFENSSACRIYIYILPVEKDDSVSNNIIMHIDYGGAEQELYSRDIYAHVCEAIGYNNETDASVRYEADVNNLKMSGNKSYSSLGNDIEKIRGK